MTRDRAPWERRAEALRDLPTGPDGLPLTLADYETAFDRILPPSSHAYYAGGGADEITMRANATAWSERTLWPRVLRGVDAVDTTIGLLGTRLAHPFVVAPTAFHGLADPEAEIATARGAREAGALYVLSTLAHTAPADRTSDASLIRHQGREYGYILRGTLHVRIGFRDHELHPGDSIAFDSTTPHRLENRGDEPVEAIWFVVGRDADRRSDGPSGGPV